MALTADIYEKYEDAIKTRLDSLASLGIKVRVAPESAKDWTTPFKKGMVTISYIGSDFNKNDPELENQMSLGVVAQKDIMKFSISCEGRTRRGALGVLRTVRIVTSLLLGFRPYGSGKMYMLEQAFEDYNVDLQSWAYNIVMASEAILIQKLDSETQVMLETIKLSNNLGDEVTFPIDDEAVEPEPEPEPEEPELP